jgi:hypothetical protein
MPNIVQPPFYFINNVHFSRRGFVARPFLRVKQAAVHGREIHLKFNGLKNVTPYPALNLRIAAKPLKAVRSCFPSSVSVEMNSTSVLNLSAVSQSS